MAGFLNSTDISTITGQYQTLFNTLAIDNIIVHKEPKKSFVATNYDVGVLQGYAAPSVESNIQYIQESGVFPAIVKPNKVQKGDPLLSLNAVAWKGETIIKVSETAGLYIKNKKTLYITISGQDTTSDVYTIISDEGMENFQGLRFYIFGLTKTL